MSSRRRGLLVAGAIAALVGLLAWRSCGSSTIEAPPDARGFVISKARLRLRDLARQPTGMINGVVTLAGKPAEGALVCTRFADDDRDDEPRCVPAAGGRYRFADLRPGGYLVWASLPGVVGTRWRDRDGNERIPLAAGASREIDLVFDGLRGVELSGRVRDTRGRAVAGALVHVRTEHKSPAFTARTAGDGTFHARATGASASVVATADGYVDAAAETGLPATALELTLLPGATLAGVVVETGTRAPIADARVWVGGTQVVTGDDGKFRATKLRPGRYKPTATSIGGYGEAAESILLRVGATVETVEIEIHPVAVVAARIVIQPAAPVTGSSTGNAKGCPEGEGSVQLARRGSLEFAFGRTIGDGDVLIEGVVAGTYAVNVHCAGHLSAGSYPDLVIGNSDVEDVVWSVEPGARLAGRVVAKGGTPIASAQVGVRAEIGHGAGATTDADGRFAVTGLPPGQLTVTAAAIGYVSAEVKAQAGGAEPTLALELDRSGSIEGIVVDRAGVPVPNMRVEVRAGDSQYGPNATSGIAGEFSLMGLDPGTYQVVAVSKWDLGYSSRTIGKPVRAVVDRGSAPVRVRVEIDRETGSITGAVVDARGAPLADVAIDVALTAPDLEVRRRDWELALAWSSATGTFEIASLPDHALAVRARIDGADEVVVDNVKLGDRVTLTLGPTGMLAGVVVDPSGAPVDDVSLDVEDRAQDISRRERLFHTGGKFTFRDLPAGTYRITADEDRQTSITVPLDAGGQRTGLSLSLRPRHAIKGRLVSADRKPLARWKLEVPHKQSAEFKPNGGQVVLFDLETTITNAAGEFLLEGLVGAEVTISAGDLATGGDMGEVKTVSLVGPPVIDLGDVVVAPK